MVYRLFTLSNITYTLTYIYLSLFHLLNMSARDFLKRVVKYADLPREEERIDILSRKEGEFVEDANISENIQKCLFTFDANKNSIKSLQNHFSEFFWFFYEIRLHEFERCPHSFSAMNVREGVSNYPDAIYCLVLEDYIKNDGWERLKRIVEDYANREEHLIDKFFIITSLRRGTCGLGDNWDNLVSLIDKYCEKRESTLRVFDIDDIEKTFLEYKDVKAITRKRFNEIQQIGESIMRYMHDNCVWKQT